MKFRQFAAPVLVLASVFSQFAHAHADAAHVKAENAWLRASVPGQQASGGFMVLTAQELSSWSAWRPRQRAWPKCMR